MSLYNCAPILSETAPNPNVMTELFRLFTQIALSRKGPQDLPASPLLLALTALIEIAHGFRRATAAGQRAAWVRGGITLAMGILLVHSPYLATSALVLFLAGWFGLGIPIIVSTTPMPLGMAMGGLLGARGWSCYHGAGDHLSRGFGSESPCSSACF